MSPRRTPTLRGQWLGQQLREAREEAELTLKEAGEHIQRDQSTISRMEAGIAPPRELDLVALLNLYGIDDEEERRRLERLCQDVWRKGWWDGYSRHVAAPLMDFTWLEERAHAFRLFEPLTMPGLLQTRDYAAAAIRAAALSESGKRVSRWIDFRMQRQAVLTTEHPPQLSVVLDESVVRRAVGGPEVQRAQLAHLREVVDQGRHSIRVLPFRAGAHASPDGAFRIFAMPEPYPEVVYVETPAGGLYVEIPETERFTQMYDQLWELSLGADASVERISAAMEDLE